MATLQGQPLLPSVALSSRSALKGLALSRPGRAAPSDPPQSPPGPLPPLCHCGSRPTGNPSTSRKPPCGGSHASQGHHLWPACKSTPKPLSCVRKEGDCGTASRPTSVCGLSQSTERAVSWGHHKFGRPARMADWSSGESWGGSESSGSPTSWRRASGKARESFLCWESGGCRQDQHPAQPQGRVALAPLPRGTSSGMMTFL